MSTLRETGEHEAIRRIVAKLGEHPELVVGAGDDCAVCAVPATGSDQVFTTDPLVEGVHFLAGEKPERVGHKAVGRVLSDIAAMGAAPQWILVNVVAPPESGIDYLERVYDGMNGLCERFGTVIIGGDLAQGPVFELHVFGTGLVPSGNALLRSGATVGDLIYVTGPLGCSLEGKHLDFMPRVEEGLFLRESGAVNSMMDISDGLATDLRHIISQSGVGAILDRGQIPSNGSLEQALFDGEDFELLLTVPEEQANVLEDTWRERFSSTLHRVGVISDKAGVLELSADGCVEVIQSKAFEHFSDNQGGRNE